MDEASDMRGMQGQPVGTGMGIAGFVLGLISVISFGWLGFLAIPGLILSILQVKKRKTGLAIAGIVLSSIGIILMLLIILVIVFAASMLGILWGSMNFSDVNFTSFNSSYDSYGSYSTSNECTNVDIEILRINEADNSVVIRKNAGAEYIKNVIVYVDSDSSASADVSSLGIGQERLVTVPSIESGDWVRLKVFIDGKECFMSADTEFAD